MEACGGAVSPAAREELMRIKAGRSAACRVRSVRFRTVLSCRLGDPGLQEL